MKEITLDEYVLTNIDIETLSFVIRLNDGKEYPVFGSSFIIKDGIKIPLSKEVKKCYIQSVREYKISGI